MNLAQILQAIKNLIAAFAGQQAAATIPMPPPNPSTPKFTVSQFCKALENLEGYFPGSTSWHYNNPGNIRCNAVMNRFADHCSPGGYCVFRTFAVGFHALQDNITNVMEGHADKYGYMPAMTLLEFFERRDPPTDGNDPQKCVDNVCAYLGITGNPRLIDLIII